MAVASGALRRTRRCASEFLALDRKKQHDMSLLASSRKRCPGLSKQQPRGQDARRNCSRGAHTRAAAMRRCIGCPCSLHLACYVLLRAANADLRRPGSQRAREDVGAAIPCASTNSNGSQRIEKTRFAAGARGRVAYVAVVRRTTRTKFYRYTSARVAEA